MREIADAPPVQRSLQQVCQVAPLGQQPVTRLRRLQELPVLLLDPPVRRGVQALAALQKPGIETVNEAGKGGKADPAIERSLRQHADEPLPRLAVLALQLAGPQHRMI